jgi:HEAT repeats
VSVLDVPNLVAKSDLVAVGRVTFVIDAGPTSIDTSNGTIEARWKAGELMIDQVLKGPTDLRSVRFQFKLTDMFVGYSGVSPNEYRILFLRRNGDEYEFTSPYHPSIIAMQRSTATAREPIDKVVEILGAMLQSSVASQQQKCEAIYVLQTVNSALSISTLKPSLHSPDRRVQLTAAAALLLLNDVSALPIAEAALLHPEAGLRPELLFNLHAAIHERVRAGAAVPALVRLLASSDVTIRRAATAALGNSSSPSAIRPLIRALDDPDFEVRLSAVQGLAEVTGQKQLRPSIDGFRSNEARYVDYWKEWIAGR